MTEVEKLIYRKAVVDRAVESIKKSDHQGPEIVGDIALSFGEYSARFVEMAVDHFWFTRIENYVLPNYTAIYNALVDGGHTQWKQLDLNDGDFWVWYIQHESQKIITYSDQNRQTLLVLRDNKWLNARRLRRTKHSWSDPTARHISYYQDRGFNLENHDIDDPAFIFTYDGIAFNHPTIGKFDDIKRIVEVDFPTLVGELLEKENSLLTSDTLTGKL